MELSPPSATEGSATKDPVIRVMLVDDSAVIRGLISRTLEKDKSILITGSVSNGEMAVNSVRRANPDVIILDIEMPVMSGLEAIPLLLKEKPGVKILMCSTLSLRGADITLKALTLGATECIAKPTSSTEMITAGDFSAELLRLIKGLGQSPAPLKETESGAKTRPLRTPGAKTAEAEKPPIKLRRDAFAYTGKPDILAIGSSTGGPQALMNLMKSFTTFDIPIVITQHMPKTFTTVLARHITQHCGIPCYEGEEGMVLQKGNAYVAPGGFHMKIVRNDNNQSCIHIDDGVPENYCKPSVDPMIRSLIELYGRKILTIILTGMGRDGLESCRSLVELGGRVIAQDQATSVVWGMPGAVAEAGLCTEVLPLNEIGSWACNAVMGRKRQTEQ